MEKRSLGIIQAVIAFLTLLFAIWVFQNETHSFYFLWSSFFLDDAKIVFSIGTIVFLLMGIQNIYEESKFWQSKIVYIIIAILTLIVLINFQNISFLLIFLALLFQQVQNMSQFAKDKTIASVELTALILVVIISLINIMQSIFYPTSYGEGTLVNPMEQILNVYLIISFSLMLLFNIIFNFKSKK